MAVDTLANVGVLAVVSSNNVGYFGFGGDALNVIRMSYDNPKPQPLPEFETLFPRTFAHELAHKLQDEFLFSIPRGRYISEASADFIKTIVLLDSGVIQTNGARGIAEKALAECSKFASLLSVDAKIAQRNVPTTTASPMNAAAFMASLRNALSGDKI